MSSGYLVHTTQYILCRPAARHFGPIQGAAPTVTMGRLFVLDIPFRTYEIICTKPEALVHARAVARERPMYDIVCW